MQLFDFVSIATASAFSLCLKERCRRFMQLETFTSRMTQSIRHSDAKYTSLSPKFYSTTQGPRSPQASAACWASARAWRSHRIADHRIAEKNQRKRHCFFGMSAGTEGNTLSCPRCLLGPTCLTYIQVLADDTASNRAAHARTEIIQHPILLPPKLTGPSKPATLKGQPCQTQKIKLSGASRSSSSACFAACLPNRCCGLMACLGAHALRYAVPGHGRLLHSRAWIGP